MRRRIPCVTLLAVFTVIAGVSLFAAGVLLAGVTGTPHDFSANGPFTTTLGASGVCSPCHIPHKAKDSFIWARFLGDATSGYRYYLNKADGSGDNNYLYGQTLQCYDCHDYAGNPTPFTGSGVLHEENILDGGSTSVPAKGSFTARHRPQDIAFGMRYPTFIPPSGGYDGDWTDDGPGGTEEGYFENSPPNNTPARDDSGTSGRFGVGNPSGTPNPGGHYFKTADPIATGTAPLRKGDKIPCSDCHDPHDYTNQAFIKTGISGFGGSSGPFDKASEYMSNRMGSPVNRLRSNAESRNLCNACHTLPPSAAITYTSINPDYSSANIVQRPTSIAEHLSGSGTACTQCHKHNNVFASCSQCHGYPPGPGTLPAYPAVTGFRFFVPAGNPGDNDSHPRHKGNQSGGAPNSFSVYSFDCDACHYGSFGAGASLNKHQDNLVSVLLQGIYTKNGGTYDNTNYFNPSFPTGATGQLDNTQSATGWGGTTNRPLGDTYGWNQCKNVYCHSAGRIQGSMPADCTALYPRPKWNSGPLGCNGCHGPGTTGTGYGMPNYPGGAAGSDNANSHAAHVVANGKECSLCHALTVTGSGAGRSILGTVPSKHVNRIRDVDFSGVAAGGTYDNNPAPKTCRVSCHGNNPVQWGGPPQSCDTCHVRAGDVDDFGTGTQASMTGNGVTAGIDNTEWNTAGHGRSAGNYPVSDNPPADLLSGSTGTNKCAFCHDPGIAHDNAANPFRLANNNWNGLDWNGNCYRCHSSVAGKASVGYAPSADNTGSYALKTASAGAQVGNNHFNPGSASNARHSSTYNGGKFCWDCHDPHGDNNIYLIGKKVSMATDNVYGIPTGGTNGAGRRDAVFTNNVNGLDYASTDNVAPYTGICETCHDSASGILHYARTGRMDSTHFTTKCVTCHTHDGGFKGLGGPDVGQYFDRSIQAPGPLNFFDNSSHPLRGLTTGDVALRFAGTVNCLSCHYSSGAARVSDECLMCHYENIDGSQGRHMNGVIELTSMPAGNTLPTSQYTIGTIQQYDSWCLQCHSVTTYSLGNIFPSASRRTVIDTTDWQNGQHRANAVGCIYCHQPHGRGNVRIVRENPDNRRTAGVVPMKFGVFPADNLSGGSYGAAQNMPYRARVDNDAATGNVFADADDDTSFCNTACHQAKTNFRYAKDKKIRRDAATGNYLPVGSGISSKKVYLIQGANASPTEYTNDNIAFPSDKHGHPNGEVISTNDMVNWWKALINLSGPSFYKYPGTGNANPDTYDNAANLAAAQAGNLWLFPDVLDGARDFPNGYNGFGRIRYRYSCSTCHNPHGTPEANGVNENGYPDLRKRRTNPPDLCNQCHK